MFSGEKVHFYGAVDFNSVSRILPYPTELGSARFMSMSRHQGQDDAVVYPYGSDAIGRSADHPADKASKINRGYPIPTGSKKPPIGTRTGQKTPPGPTLVQFFRLLPELLRDAPHVLLQLFQEYGDVVCLGDRRLRLFFILSHPQHIKHVLQDNYLNFSKGSIYDELRMIHGDGLVTSEGDMWRRQRKQSQPAFYHDHDEEYARIIVDATTTMLDRWTAVAQSHRALDIREEMRTLTLEILLKCLFSTDLAPVAEALCPALDLAEKHIHLASRLNPLKPLLERLPTPANLRFRRALRTIDHFAYGILQQRSQCPLHNGDFVSLLLAEEKNGGGLDDQHKRDAMITLVDSGFDSTAGAITWAWYLLSRNPGCARTLQAELRDVLHGRTPTFEDLPQLRYTRMVVQETLRLYPSAWAIARTVINDDEIDGYRIPAKSMIVISPYVAHRRVASWENPEGFDPERFSPERSENRSQFAYIPFGGGPRLCLGIRFALMEAELALATIAQRWRLDLLPGPPIGIKPTISLRPQSTIMMTLHSASGEGSDVVHAA